MFWIVFLRTLAVNSVSDFVVVPATDWSGYLFVLLQWFHCINLFHNVSTIDWSDCPSVSTQWHYCFNLFRNVLHHTDQTIYLSQFGVLIASICSVKTFLLHFVFWISRLRTPNLKDIQSGTKWSCIVYIVRREVIISLSAQCCVKWYRSICTVWRKLILFCLHSLCKVILLCLHSLVLSDHIICLRSLVIVVLFLSAQSVIKRSCFCLHSIIKWSFCCFVCTVWFKVIFFCPSSLAKSDPVGVVCM